jgi:hypothetical protein
MVRISTDDDYRRWAEEAEQQARLAKHDFDRESWLRFAEGFKILLRERPQRCTDPDTPDSLQ